MRSRTSRGVPEWSGGEELYIGSQVSATGKVSGVTGIVPGPPEGSRGSIGWGHLSRRAPWAEVGGQPALSGLGRAPWASPLRLGLETLGWGAPHLPWGQGTPLAAAPHLDGVWPAPPSQGAYIKGGREGSNISALGASLLPCNTSLFLSQKLGEALPETRYIHHHAVVLLDLHQPLLPPFWIKAWETSPGCTCIERGGACRPFGTRISGDLDHDEYDSFNPVLLNASA